MAMDSALRTDGGKKPLATAPHSVPSAQPQRDHHAEQIALAHLPLCPDATASNPVIIKLNSMRSMRPALQLWGEERLIRA